MKKDTVIFLKVAIGYYDAKLLLEASKETRIHMQMVFALLMGLSQP